MWLSGKGLLVGNVLGFDLVSTVLITVITNCLYLQKKKRAASDRNGPSPAIFVINQKPCHGMSSVQWWNITSQPLLPARNNPGLFNALLHLVGQPLSWCSLPKATTERTQGTNQQPPHPMGHLKHVLIQKTLMVMEQDFRHPFSARSKVRSFRSSSLIFWMTDEALSPSLSQFLLPKAPSAWQQWLHSSACRSPKHTSLLITYSSIPRGLYSADELQLCN